MRRLITPPAPLLAPLIGLAFVPACSNKADPSQQRDGQGVTNPVPRFPAAGITGSTQPTGAGPGGSTQSTSAEPGPGGQQSSPVQTTDDKGAAGNTGTTSGNDTSELPKTSSAPKGTTTQAPDPKPEPRPKPKPGKAAFVDWGLFRIASKDDGSYFNTAKRRTPKNEHQLTRLGHERIPPAFGGFGLLITRRTYGIFDVSQVHDATGARLEYYVFASSLKSAGSGGYSSPDPSETVEIRSLDRFTPQEIINAPFGQSANHSLDPKISDDLADGRLYGRFEISPAFLAVDKISPGPTATPGRSDCSDENERACGRWLTIPLTAEAVKDINESDDLWAMGWNMVSVDHTTGDERIQEFLFFGAHMDTSPINTGLLPDYIKPKPRLILEYKKSKPNKEKNQ